MDQYENEVKREGGLFESIQYNTDLAKGSLFLFFLTGIHTHRRSVLALSFALSLSPISFSSSSSSL
jgi:hypothetical protein